MIDRKKIFRIVTVIMAVTVIVMAAYIMINRLGLVEGYDFGGGAYYYAINFLCESFTFVWFTIA